MNNQPHELTPNDLAAYYRCKEGQDQGDKMAAHIATREADLDLIAVGYGMTRGQANDIPYSRLMEMEKELVRINQPFFDKLNPPVKAAPPAT